MIFNNTKRTNFMPTVSVGDLLEKDIIVSNWDLFEITLPIEFETIQRTDLQRPDLFALRVYGTMKYWYIISKVNDIDDWWNDVFVGKDVIVPHAKDIVNFFTKIRSRQRKEEQ